MIKKKRIEIRELGKGVLITNPDEKIIMSQLMSCFIMIVGMGMNAVKGDRSTCKG